MYVPKKAGAQELQPGVNQLQSSLESVIKIEEARKYKIDSDIAASFKPALKQQNPKERQGNDIFNWTNHTDEQQKGGKRKYTATAQHEQHHHNSGNFLYWSTPGGK